jgi:hypothetical protein
MENTGRMILQNMPPPKWNKKVPVSEVEKAMFYQSYIDYVDASEAAAIQAVMSCTPVLLRLCMGTKVLEAAILAAKFQRTTPQPKVTVQNVTVTELKDWLRPVRDETRQLADHELEKVLERCTWQFVGTLEFACDRLIHSVTEMFFDKELKNLFEEDSSVRPDAIVKIVFEKTGNDIF